MNFQLKPDLLLGAADAAAGVEGGVTNNNWDRSYAQGHRRAGACPAAPADRFERWEEDVGLIAGMGLQCYRMAVDWSRVEPEDGVFDEAALARCRRMLQALADRGVRPLLTLHHFSTPLWLEERGGFAAAGSVTCFLRYVRKVVESVGDLVSEYVTINEPNLYAYNGWMTGAWPPGRRNLLEMARVMTNLAAAHVEAYGLIRKTRLQMGFRDTRVGFASHLRAFAPKNSADPVHRFWASRARQIFQGSLTQAMCTGRAAFPVGPHPSLVPGQYCDFHGVSYYARSTVSGPADGAAEGRPVSDLGWEIDPEGITEVCRSVYDLLPRPIYITGNGVCDNGDRFRSRYIAEHLEALCGSDLPVERYYYDAFCDGGAWPEGPSARFGLVGLEGADRERRVKRSGEFYRQVIAQGGVSEELYRTYCGAPYPTVRRES